MKLNVEYILPLSDSRATLETAGGKGASLARLSRAGLPVPDGFHITTLAYQHFITANHLQSRIVTALGQVDVSVPATLEQASLAIRDLFSKSEIPVEIAQSIVEAYGSLPGIHPAVAVRSSATAEDLPEASFAGQQETYLNICGAQAVLEATKRCWASLWTARAIAYRARQGILPEGIALAVVVQLLVPAESAGVLFTANPVTGRRDQAVISASWGLGEAIVGGLVTPDLLNVDKATGRVLERKISEKQVMTVRQDGGTREQAVPINKQRQPVLDDGAAAELARLGVQVENIFGAPVDIEWALAGGKFAILQARPVTALPVEPPLRQEASLLEPEPMLATEWKLPKGCYAAMRNNIVELMADPLTPLFATLGLSVINTSMHRLMSESFGMPGIMPPEIIILVNHYAYNNGSLKPGKLVRVLLTSGKILKKMFTGAVERWTDSGQPRYIQTVERWQAKSWQGLAAAEILGGIRELFEAALDAYFALISGVIPAAWISEAQFTALYKLLIKRRNTRRNTRRNKRRNDPSAPIFLLGFDSVPIKAEKSLFDLAGWIRSMPALAVYLQQSSTQQLVAQFNNPQAPPKISPEDWQAWQARFQGHLRQYGHTIYNLDFSNPVPADDPAPLLDTLKLYLSGQGVNPYLRQQASVERREQAIQSIDQRLKGLRRKWFRKYLARAQRYAPLREDGLAEIGLAYPLLRQMLRELGRRFAQGGLIAGADDIFWLTEDEVQKAATRLDTGQTLGSLAGFIPPRKAAWNAARQATPPLMLPQMKVFGIDLMQLKSRRQRVRAGKTIKGVACSPGSVTAQANVIRGPEDFSQMKPGDILVAAITTPAWTPLFVMASGIVTDVGGPLSHGSIVAREYGIPAVLGTGVATRRIQSGQVICVDGTAGLVTLSSDG